MQLGNTQSMNKNVRGQHHYNVRVLVIPEVCTITVPARSAAKLNENLIHEENGGKTVYLLDCNPQFHPL